MTSDEIERHARPNEAGTAGDHDTHREKSGTCSPDGSVAPHAFVLARMPSTCRTRGVRPVALVTVCPADRLADAVALGRSFLDHHPGAAVRIVVADGTEPMPSPVDGIEIVGAPDVAGAAAEVLAAGHEPVEYARALRPFAVRGLARPVVCLDLVPPIDGPLELPEGAAVVVLGAGEADPQRGPLVPGFVAVGDGAEADEVLAWWRDRVGTFAEGDDLQAALARFPAVTVTHEDHLRELASPPGDPTPPRDGATYPSSLRRDLSRLGDGTPLDHRLRTLFRRAIRDGDLQAGPFTTDGSAAFLRWLGEADPRAEAGGVARVLVHLWEDQEALQRAYPNLQDATDRAGFLGWAAQHGAQQLGVPAAAVPDLRDETERHERAPLGVNIAGYFQSESGVGEAARRMVGALDAARIPVLPIQGDIVPPTRRGHAFGSTALEAASFDVNLVCVNADGLPRFASEAGPRFFDGRYTIGLWWWELPTFPDRYLESADHVDEIWVGSRYVQDAIAPAVPVPVVRMPLPVVAPSVAAVPRAELGVPEGFLVLFVFDFHSVMERKNPLGLITAFRRAFPPGSGASLVIKTINGEHHPAAARRLAEAAAEHEDVHLVERFLSAAERDALLASCDAYVSLHRSEGFGLTVAEAMALGRPVVATDHGGTCDFLDARCGWPIPYDLVDVGPGNDPYDADARWADPDLDAAADALRAIRDDPGEAARRGERAARRMREEYSAEAVGAVLRKRLEALRPAIDQRASRTSDPVVDAVRAALAHARSHTVHEPGEVVPEGLNAVRRWLRGRVTKAARPISADVLAADRAIVETLELAVDALVAELERSRTVHGALTASVLAEQRRIEAALPARQEQPGQDA